MLRIAHTESSINMGGQELRILEQIRWLLDNGHSAWLLAREDSAVYGEACRRGLPVHAVPFRGSVNPGAISGLLHFALHQQVDLIDCHSSRDASTALFARLLGIPVVRTQHVCDYLKDDFFHRLVWSWGCGRIVAVSDSIADRIVGQKLGAREMIDVIGEGVDLERFRPDIDGGPARRAFGIPDAARVITVVGMIRPDKGQRYLVRAVDRIVEEIPQAWFLFVGSPTRQEFLTQLQGEIDGIVHKDRVILAGFQTRVEDFIAASDVIVLTSEIEARSRTIPQAFAMRKLVVASNVGGIPEYVRDGETGFLYPRGDHEELARLIVEALSGDRTSLLEEAYRLAHELGGFEAMMHSTLQCYRRMLE